MLFGLMIVTTLHAVVCMDPPSSVPVSIKTRLGSIQGLQHHKDQTTFYSFRGIPYAAPPVGALRWTEPTSPPPWTEGHLDATQRPSGCIRYGFDDQPTGDEDCLYLNIYTSELPDDGTSNELLPVLVYIHGGAFMRGQAPGHASVGLLRRKMVIVTINYRLGALGFLASGDSVIPGNYGLLDQVAALHWVQKNVNDYGGDTAKVTIMGFSAGASSVFFHSISPLSQGLFTNAVLMSGSGTCDWASNHNSQAKHKTHQLADLLNCPKNSSSTLRQCLQDKTGPEIIIAQEEMHRYIFWPVPFAPVVDENLRANPFLPSNPRSLTPNVPGSVIIGMVPNEALFFTTELFLRSTNPENANDIYDEAVLYTIESVYLDSQKAANAAKIAETFYYSPSARHSRDTLLEQMTEAVTDFLFTSCIWDTAANFVNNNIPVYAYVMSHRHIGWALPVYHKAEKQGISSPLFKTGVSHGDCTALLDIMPFPFQDMVREGKYGVDFSENDEEVKELITDLWSNFILTGSPVSKSMSSGNAPKWLPVQPGGPITYFDISIRPSMVQNTFRNKEKNFWTQTLPALLNPPADKTVMTQHEEL